MEETEGTSAKGGNEGRVSLMDRYISDARTDCQSLQRERNPIAFSGFGPDGRSVIT